MLYSVAVSSLYLLIQLLISLNQGYTLYICIITLISITHAHANKIDTRMKSNSVYYLAETFPFLTNNHMTDDAGGEE